MEEIEKILEALQGAGVEFELHRHEPVGNVLDRVGMGLCFDATTCKNLFVTTRKRERVFLVMVRADHRGDLHALAKHLGTTHLGFAPQELLGQLLGQSPGAVGPLGILQDSQGRVEVVLDESLRGAPRVAMHPSINTATVVLAMDALVGLIGSCGNRVYWMNFGE